MYINVTVIKVIVYAMWIGAICLGIHIRHSESMSNDLKNFLSTSAIVIMILAFFIGLHFNIF